jgi:hypothetical protein
MGTLDQQPGVKATIMLDGADWVASVAGGSSLRFPHSFYGEGAWRHAQTWAEHRGARTIEWVPCPLQERHGSGGTCAICSKDEHEPVRSPAG